MSDLLMKQVERLDMGFASRVGVIESLKASHHLSLSSADSLALQLSVKTFFGMVTKSTAVVADADIDLQSLQNPRGLVACICGCTGICHCISVPRRPPAVATLSWR